MAIDYGEASAGKLTANNICDIGWSKWLCSGADGEVWWEAGRDWAMFVRDLVRLLRKMEPVSSWPESRSITVASAEAAAKKFDGSAPFLIYEAEIASWAETQQYLRDVAGIFATTLQAGGVPLPPAPGQLRKGGNTALYVALGVGAVTLVGVSAYLVARNRKSAREAAVHAALDGLVVL